MNIVEQIKNKIIEESKKFIERYEDYNHWNQHIKYVQRRANELAEIYDADREVVEIGALLHDIALVTKTGIRADHHINGARLARKILEDLGYPEEKIKKVEGCVLHHRTCKNAENLEELCVADADILAHFDNIPMIFQYAYMQNNFNNLEQAREYLKIWLEKDYDDLSDKTKSWFKSQYENIMNVLFVE